MDTKLNLSNESSESIRNNKIFMLRRNKDYSLTFIPGEKKGKIYFLPEKASY